MIPNNLIQLPDHSRLWIYQSDRKLSADEQSLILSKGKEFTSGWAAHGHDLMAELTIVFDYFIILALDEQVESASGCSIDKSVRWVLDLQKELKVNFTNRLISAFWINNEVELIPYAQLKTKLENKKISPVSLVFDNTIQSVNELKTSWLKPMGQTWLRKLLEAQNVG
jgi:hypothetical protein